MLDKYVQKNELNKLRIFLPKQTENLGLLNFPFKLSIFTQFFPPDFAATGQLIEELAVNLGRQGIQVKVFTGQPGYAFQKNSAASIERIERLLIRRSRTSRLWSSRIRGKAINGIFFFLRSLLHLLKQRNRGDILLLTTAPPFLPVLGYLGKLLFGIPYVCLIYDLYPDVAVQLNVIPNNHLLVKFWHWLDRKVWHQADKIIVLSSTMKERIVSRCPEIADKIAVIHNWANPDWIVPIAKQDNWFAQKYGLVDKFTVLYSGNIGRCHEIETILAAAKQLQNEQIQFVFIGGGAKLSTCTEQVKKLGLSNCHFLPYQEKRDLPYSLTACDLALVSISPGMEGIVAPSKLYGILAAGRPIAAICEPNSYLRQILAEASCGEAFNTGNATGLAKFIRRLAQNTEAGHQMGIAGRRYLQFHFTPKIIAKQYSSLLRQVVLAEKGRLTQAVKAKAEILTEETQS